VQLVASAHGSYVRGVQTCGSVWSCPTCARKIQSERAREIQQAAGAHAGAFVMVTLTLQHSRGQDLESGIEAVYRAWDSIVRARGYRTWAQRVGLAGYVKAVEVTDGENGWHPHIHALLFVESITPQQEIDLQEYLISKWRNSVIKSGFGFNRHVGAHFVAFTNSADAVAAYLAKGVAFEIAMTVSKDRQSTISQWQLLERAASGDPVAAARWSEFERATRHRRSLTWSRGIRRRLGLGAELTDDEIMERQQEEGEVVVLVPAKSWRRLARLCAPELLVLVAARDNVSIHLLLSRHGLDWSPPDT